MRDLLPYLAGAASAFVVQFLVQVYVVPLVETRRRRLERWEKNVLDLGELVSGPIGDAAMEAKTAQFGARYTKQMVGDPEFPQEFVERELRKYLTAARESTNSFEGQANSRVNWLMDRIASYHQGDQVVEFVRASMLYRLHVIKPAPGDWQKLPDDDWNAWWGKESDLRAELMAALRRLASDRHPLRTSWRSRFSRARYRIKRRLAKIRRRPIESKPAA